MKKKSRENPRNTFMKPLKEAVKDFFGMCIEYDCFEEFYAHNDSMLFWAEKEYTKEESFIRIRFAPLATFHSWEYSSVINETFTSVEEATEYLTGKTHQIYQKLFKAISEEYFKMSNHTQMKRFDLAPHPETAPLVFTASIYWWAYQLQKDNLEALKSDDTELIEAVKMKMVSLFKHLSVMPEFDGMLDPEPWMEEATFEPFEIPEELAFEWALEYWKKEEDDSKKCLQTATSYFEMLTHQQFLIDALTVIPKLKKQIKDR